MKPTKNQVVTLCVTDLNNLGCGVAHSDDGMTVFVQGAVTGDTVRARIIKVAGSYLVAKTEELLAPSPYRDDGDDCGASDSCGGCVYRHITYDYEKACKRSYVEHAFCKAGLGDVNVLPLLSADTVTAYRNKAQYPVANGKNGMEAGFYAARTHRVVSAANCLLQPPAFSQIVRVFCEFCDAHGIRAYDEETGKGLVRHLYLRRAPATGQVMVCPVINGEKFPEEEQLVKTLTRAFSDIVSVCLNVNRENTNVILGDRYRLLYGQPYMEDILCGKRFRIRPASFYQVNHDATEILYGLVAKLATDRVETPSVLDLYCGAGTIGLSFAERVRDLTGIEIVEDAVRCAKENAVLNGVQNAAFYCGDAGSPEQLLARAEKEKGTLHPDVVILDPPRKGTTPELIRFLAQRDVGNVVYVSCDPDTLARDCAIFCSLGYSVGDVTPVDLFPRTGHVENVVLLTK